MWRLLLSVLVAAVLIPLAASNQQCHVYLEGVNGDACPEMATCYNLSHIITLQQELLTNDTVVCFLAGDHFWMSEATVNVTWVSNLTLQGLGPMEPGFHWTVAQAPVYIRCLGGVFGGFMFKHCENIVLRPCPKYFVFLVTSRKNLRSVGRGKPFFAQKNFGP